MKQLLTAVTLLLVLSSCQREVNFDDVTDPTTPGGNINGDLLVKGVQLTPSTNDTNTIILGWDASRRLLSYESRGRANGVPTMISTRISRAADGKIISVVGKAAAPLSSSDSVVFDVHYAPGTNKLAYSIGTQHGGFMDGVKDSTVFTYDASGKMISRTTYNDFFGQYDLSGKQDLTYDANGNVTRIVDFAADPFSGTLSQSATTVNTFDSHKAAMTMGEECFFFLGPTNLSKNNLTKVVTNAVASGTTYNNTITGQQFNSFDRPTKGTITTSPVGLVTNVFFYYQ